MTGELLKIDANQRGGEFRADGTGVVVDFTLPPFGSARYLNAEGDLSDLPLGTRYRFYLHPDEKGAFTKASLVVDDFTFLRDEHLTCRVESVSPGEGKIALARQLDEMRDDKDHAVRPPDLGRGMFAIDDKTRVWKGDRRVPLADLSVGDELLVNFGGSTVTSRPRCADIWVGTETHKLVTERRRDAHTAAARERGLPGWIDSVDGKTFTVTFFAGSRKDFPKILGDDPWGKPVFATLADDELRPEGAGVKMNLKNHPPEGETAGTYGYSGVRWVIEANPLPEGYRPGRVVRVWKEEWKPKAAVKE